MDSQNIANKYIINLPKTSTWRYSEFQERFLLLLELYTFCRVQIKASKYSDCCHLVAVGWKGKLELLMRFSTKFLYGSRLVDTFQTNKYLFRCFFMKHFWAICQGLFWRPKRKLWITLLNYCFLRMETWWICQ